MSRAWDKAKTGAKWLGAAGAIFGAIVGASVAAPGVVGFLVAASVGAALYGVTGMLSGGILGSIYGAVTHGKKPASEEMGYANAREAVQKSMAPDIAQQQAQMQSESYSRGFQDAVLQSRTPSPAQATR